MMAEESDRQAPARMFFALWPGAAVRQQVAQHRPRAGRLVIPDNWHLTLLFLGAVTREQRHALELAAQEIQIASFRLVLDYLDHWRRSSLTWLGLTEPPKSLLSLHAQLKARAESLGFAIETREYVPHLSLAREAPAEMRRSIEAIPWDVDEFCLAESVPTPSGVRYKVRQRWPLQQS